MHALHHSSWRWEGGGGVLASGQIEVLLVTMKPTYIFWPNCIVANFGNFISGTGNHTQTSLLCSLHCSGIARIGEMVGHTWHYSDFFY